MNIFSTIEMILIAYSVRQRNNMFETLATIWLGIQLAGMVFGAVVLVVCGIAYLYVQWCDREKDNE